MHENNLVSKIEKKIFLELFSLDSFDCNMQLELYKVNYETTISILQKRFGQRDIITNNHMNKLLNIA